MKVHGMVDPGSFTVEQIPGTNRSLVRLFQNVEPYHEENLKKGMDNEVDRSNEALFQAQQKTDIAVQDMDGMSVDHEYRLTLLELGLSETDI